MRKHIFISGRVQGVGFRYFTRKNAEALGVNGWVKNLPDGRVEAVLDGDKESIEELLERCRNGPATSYIKEIEEEKMKTEETFSGFSVRF